MGNSNRSQGAESWTYAIVLMLAVIAFAAPYAFSLVYDSFDHIYVLRISSLLWIHESNTTDPIFFYPVLVISNPIHSILRSWFVYEVYKAYLMQSTKKHAIIIGCLSELWPLSMFVYANLLFPSIGPFELYIVPIPVLLLVGLLVLKARPPPIPPEFSFSIQEMRETKM